MGVDFGEQEYLAVLEFLQCMSNIVINDGGTGLFAKLQVGTLLHGDKYVFVTEASQLGFWSIGQVFSRYRNYEGEKDRPLTEPEIGHLNRLMDEATVVVNKFVESDPEQARWHARICEGFDGTQVSVIATPWDRSLANRVPLDLGAVAGATLDAKLAMAELVLRGVDRADRRRRGLPEPETEAPGSNPWSEAWPPHRPLPPLAPAGGPDNGAAQPDSAHVPVIAARPEPDGAGYPPDGPAAEPGPPRAWILPAPPEPGSPGAGPDIPG